MGTAAAVVSGGILLSRLLGLVREGLIAGLIGVNAEGDLYRHAFAIPDFLSYLLAGAYLTITLIPILSRHIENDDKVAADRAFSSVFRFVAYGVIGLTAVMWFAAPALVDLVFPAITEDRDRLISLTRIVLPAQIFLVLGSVLMAGQYTYKRFVIPALAPLIYNLGIIGGGLVGYWMGEASPEAFLWGAVAGSAIGNFGLQWLGSKRTGLRLVPVPKGSSAVGEYLILALPLMLGQSVAVLDEQFVRWFGQIQEGAASALSFARQINMVPVGVIAQAAGVAAYPFLARLATGGKTSELNETTERAAKNTVFVAAAATAVLVVLARPLVQLLYEYGKTTDSDADTIAGLLVIYAFSIPAWGLHQLISRHFYAKRRMWVPVGIGTAATAIAIPTWLLLYDQLGVDGFALASTIVMTLYALGLLVAWGRDAGWGGVRRVAPSFLRGLISAGVAAAVGIPVVNAISPAVNRGFVVTSGVALVGVTTTLAAFMLVSRLLRAPELDALRGRNPPTSAS
ncbi:MAG: murein biosynthesis integral membrane protein MurJ [Acidimicrobiia bacterium]|nr:murein biosynthesis integral membrane protein MurJ [Acidimicrobiia bacterium]